jgi:hypothetical protein
MPHAEHETNPDGIINRINDGKYVERHREKAAYKEWLPVATSYVPVRKLHHDGRITVRFLNADGTVPPAGAVLPSTEEYPETRLSDERYKLDTFTGARGQQRRSNFLWLSENNPLLFEELLRFLEEVTDYESASVNRLLVHGLKPEKSLPESYIYTYYRLFIDNKRLIFSLAADGWRGREDIRAWSIFIAARTACGYTVEHPYFKAAILAVWIMQDRNDPLKAPLWAKDNEESLAFINKHFDEVCAHRHEFRSRAIIAPATIEAFLRHDGPLRLGSL